MTLAGTGIAQADTVSATTTATTHVGLIQALASRFNLSIADLQSFFKDRFTQKQAKVEEKEQNHLDKAVTNGKLTQAQVTLVTAEQASIKGQVEAMKGKTGADLKTAMDALKTSVQAWSTANNIPLQYVMPRMGMMGAIKSDFGFGRGFKMGWFMHASSTPDRDKGQ